MLKARIPLPVLSALTHPSGVISLYCCSAYLISHRRRPTHNDSTPLFVISCSGFEKMDFGLSENFPDRESPISQHLESLHSLGAPRGPLNKYVNEITSDVVKVHRVVVFTFRGIGQCYMYM